METTVKTSIMDGKRIIVMDDEIYELRRKIWKTIFNERGVCLIAMFLWHWGLCSMS